MPFGIGLGDDIIVKCTLLIHNNPLAQADRCTTGPIMEK